MEQKRKELYPVMRRLQQNPLNKVTLVREKLYLNGHIYIPLESDQTRNVFQNTQFIHENRAAIGTQQPPRRMASANRQLRNRYEPLAYSDGEL